MSSEKFLLTIEEESGIIVGPQPVALARFTKMSTLYGIFSRSEASYNLIRPFPEMPHFFAASLRSDNNTLLNIVKLYGWSARSESFYIKNGGAPLTFY